MTESGQPAASQHVAVGPDGANLLGYLATLGSLALLARAWPDRVVRLSWSLPTEGPAAGAWRAVFHVEPGVQQAEVVVAIASAIRAPEALAPFEGLDENLSNTREELRQAVDHLLAGSRRDRRPVDLLAALVPPITREGEDAHSPLQAVRTGQQKFLKTLRELSCVVQHEHLHRALFEAWRYEDAGRNRTFRWDPVDYRAYALRARDPAEDREHPIRTEWGANRLAFEALVFFPMVWSRRPKTVGFRGDDLRWPLWTAPASVPVVRSLLAHPALYADEPGVLGRLGVCAVMGTRRFTSGKGYVNFGPTRAIWVSAPHRLRPSSTYG